MIVTRPGLEVVPPALQVSVVGVEQAPGVVALGIGDHEAGDGRRGVLKRLGDPIGLQQDLGGGGDQPPSGPGSSA